MKSPKTQRILGYSRGSDTKGRIVKHHINNVCNTICVARRDTTAIYVIEYTITARNTSKEY